MRQCENRPSCVVGVAKMAGERCHNKLNEWMPTLHHEYSTRLVLVKELVGTSGYNIGRSTEKLYCMKRGGGT